MYLGDSGSCVGSSEHKQRKLCTDLNSQGRPPSPGRTTARGKEPRQKGKKAKSLPTPVCAAALHAPLTGLLIGLHLLLHGFSSGREVERPPVRGGCSSQAPGSQAQPWRRAGTGGDEARPRADLPPQRTFQNLPHVCVVILGQDQDHL